LFVSCGKMWIIR